MLWVEEKGLYCDGRNSATPSQANRFLPEDVEGIYYSQHTNALAVLYDLAPKEKQTEIMRKVFDDPALTQAQPYFMHFVLEAAAHAGVFDEYGVTQMRRWKKLLDENPSSLKEVWSGFDCDYSHAWGGTPTYQLPSKVLGVTPLSPGYGKIGIEPTLGDLLWAKGRVPTPQGIVEVEWSRGDEPFRLNLRVPEGIPVEIRIPQSYEREAVILLNGIQLWPVKTYETALPRAEVRFM